MRKNDNRTGKKRKTCPGISRRRGESSLLLEADIENGFWAELFNSLGY